MVSQVQKPALVVIDMQNGMLPHLQNAEELLKNIKRLVSTARIHNVPIFFFRFLENSKNEARFGKTWVTPLTEAFEIPNLFDVQQSDYIFDKSEYSAFAVPEFKPLLVKHDIETIIIAGAATQVCVLATALDAYTQDYTVLIPSDCVGATNEKNQEFGLLWMRKYVASIIISSELAYL